MSWISTDCERCVRDLDPDVLALQEVDLEQDRSGRSDLTAVAAEAMGAVAHRFVAAISGTPGATWIAATGSEQPGTAAYGIALLSRFPATSWQVVRLPRIPTRFPMYLPGPNRVIVVDEEPRAAVIAQLDTPVGPLIGREHAPVLRARVEPPPTAPAGQGPARTSRTASADGRPQPHPGPGGEVVADACVGKCGNVSRAGPATPTRPYPRPIIPACVVATAMLHLRRSRIIGRWSSTSTSGSRSSSASTRIDRARRIRRSLVSGLRGTARLAASRACAREESS